METNPLETASPNAFDFLLNMYREYRQTPRIVTAKHDDMASLRLSAFFATLDRLCQDFGIADPDEIHTAIVNRYYDVLYTTS